MKNKLIINLLSIAIFSFCIYQFVRLDTKIAAQTFVNSQDITGPNSPDNNIVSEVENSSETTSNLKPELSNFPINKSKEVELSFPVEVKAELSPREEKNQIRDWLIYSIINNIGLPNESINKILHDVPIIRYGYNHAIHDLEYGELRSKLLPDNSVIALLPAGNKAKQQDDLAHIADKQRKNLGAIPEKFYVFEYKMNPKSKKASLLRKEDILGEELFSGEYLYHEAKVKNLSDLKSFMKKVQDLTYVQQEDNSLVLGGRNLKSRKYKNIRIEDIAAIWQSEAKYPERGTGFSLDPAYDFEELKSLAREYPKTVIAALKKAGLITGGYSSTVSIYDQTKIISQVVEALNERNPTPMGYVYDYVKNFGTKDNALTEYSSYLNELLGTSGREYQKYSFLNRFEEASFQAARYDGHLKGTEVGMILYYTDLLAKMWAFNYKWTTPSKRVPEFLNALNLKLSKVYEKESEKYYSGRLWFGPNQNGFQLSNDKTMLFARNATKIFAAAKDGMSATSEVPASARIGAPIYWWNNHYEEVANYEPQYEALNEIMKWSVVIVWLNKNHDSNKSLNYLKNVPVYRKNWFPTWVKKHPKLKFKKWDSIGFYPKGYKGTTTEGLPKLHSPVFLNYGIQEMTMAGGVTLARPATIARIKPITKLNVDKTLLRSNIKTSLGKNSYRTIKGTEFKVLDSRLLTKVGENARLRNTLTEFGQKPFIKSVSIESGLARFTSKIDDVPIGNLNVAPSKNGFKVGFQNRSVGQGNHLARQLSDAKNIPYTLRRSKFVDDFITLKANENYLIEVKGSARWLEIEFAKTPSVELSPSWQFRTAGFKANSKIVRQRWISPTEARIKAKTKGIKWEGENYTKRNPPKILEDYAAKNYKKITNDVLKSKKPLEFKKASKEFYKKEIKDIDELLTKSENPFLCREKLNQLDKAFPNDPAISMRRALFDLNPKFNGNPQIGVSRINRLTNGKNANRFRKTNRKLLDEINHLIIRTPMRLTNQKSVQNFVNFQKGKTNNLLIKGKDLPKGKVVNPQEAIGKLNRKEAVLYVKDSPGLNNLNWNVSTGKTLSKVLELHPNAILHKIPKQTMAKYRPELSVRTEFSPLGGLRPTITSDLVRVRAGIENSPCEEEEDENCKEVYILTLPKSI